jgi:hypothetical protein
MKYELTQHAVDVISSRGIKIEWINSTIDFPSYHQVISEVEEHFFKPIDTDEFSKKCLKVVVNPISLKIITTYFDRNMRKKGCKNEN